MGTSKLKQLRALVEGHQEHNATGNTYNGTPTTDFSEVGVTASTTAGETGSKLVQLRALVEGSTGRRTTAERIGEQTPEISTARKSFYSMPDPQADIKSVRYDVIGFENEARESARVANSRQNRADFLGKLVQAAQQAYEKNPSAQNKAYLDKFQADYQAKQEEADSWRAKYETAYGKYSEAVTKYNQEASALQASWTDWRSTIRDAQSVQEDLDAVNAQIETLREEETQAAAAPKATKPWWQYVAEGLGGTQDTTLPLGAANQQTQGGTVPVSDAMQALLDKKALLQEEYDWSRYFSYADLQQAEDFAGKSQYVSRPNGKAAQKSLQGDYYTETGYEDIDYEVINGNPDAIRKLGLNNTTNLHSFWGIDSSERQEMTPDEIAIYNYLYATQGKTAADGYLEYLTSDLTARQRETKEKEWAEYADKHPVKSSVGSILMSPLKGVSYLGQYAELAEDGKIDQNAGYNKFSYINSTIRESVAQKIEESGKWGKVGSFAYQTGMSMGDFLITTAVAGGNSTLSLVIMGSGAAADTTIAAKDRGLSDGQAFALGTIAGVAEAVTEKISIDALLDKTGLGKSAMGYILKNALAEGGEEVASGLINTLADVIIAKDKSQWQKSIDAYMADGKTSEEEAFGKALADQAIAMGLDALGGILSGTAMAGGSAVFSDVGARITGAKLGKQNMDLTDIQAIINEGLGYEADSRAHYLAQQFQQKLAAGQALSDYDIGRLYQANAQAAQATQESDREAPARTVQEEIERQWRGGQVNQNTAIDTQETLESGARTTQVAAAQMDMAEIEQQAQRLSKMLGREVVLYSQEATENGIENGYYKDGKIYVNTRSGDPVAQIISHELTHSVEFAEIYEELSAVVLRRIVGSGTNLAQLRQQTAALYAQNNAALRDNSEIDREIVADYVAKHLLTDEQSIVQLTQAQPSVGRRILEWLDRLLAKLGNSDAQERAFLSRARNLYSQALGQTRGSFTGDTAQLEPAQQTEKTAPAMPEQQSAEETAAEPAGDSSLEELKAWMREAYANGDLTEEEFDSLWDQILEREDLENSMEPAEVKHSFTGPEDAREAESAQQPTEASDNNSNADAESAENAANNYALADINWDMLRMVDRVEQDNYADNEKVFFGTVSDDVAARIEQLTGIDVSGFEVVIEARQIDHILNDHGKNGKADQSMADPNDIARMEYVLDNPDDIRSSGKTTAYVSSVNGRNRPADTVIYEKAVGDRSYYVVQAVPDTKKRTLYIVTAFIGKSGYKKGALQSTDANGPGATPEAESAKAPMTRIQQDDSEVKGKYSISPNTVAKQDVISDLRGILQRGGDPAELRQYVESLERNTGNAERNNENAYQNNVFAEHNNGFAYQNAETADQILRAAKRQGISVSQYLQENWEQYEVDGQWNAAARQALDQERSGRRRYSISPMTKADLQAVQSIGRKSVNAFTSADVKATERFAQQYWKEMGVKSPFFRAWFGDWRANDQTPVQIADQQGNARVPQKNTDTGWDIQVSGQVFNETKTHKSIASREARPYLPYINDIAKKAVLLDTYGFDASDIKSENSLLMHSLYAVADIGNGPEVLKLYVEEMNDPNSADTKKRAYQLQNIEKAFNASVRVQGNTPSSLTNTQNAIHTVADLFAAVKRMDSNFNPNPVSDAVNPDGTPMVVYHGTGAVFTAFDKRKAKVGVFGKGFYFAPTKNWAQAYSSGRIMEAYLSIKTPYIVHDSLGFTGEDYRNMQKQFGLQDKITDKNVAKILQQQGYDGIMVYGSNGNLREVIAFEPTQIKAATDNIGTFDGSNPDIRYSISPNSAQEQPTVEESAQETDPRSALPKKAQDYLKRAERKLLNDIGRNLSVPWLARRDFLQEIVQEISNEYLRTGTVADEVMDRLFDTAYQQGVVVDAEFYNQYKDLKDHVRTLPLTISKQDQSDIADYADFKRRAFGTLRIVNEGGVPVDSAYEELRDMAPELFPDYVTHPADQLQRIYDVARSIKKVEKSLAEFYGEDAAEYKRWARNDFAEAINDIAGELWRVKRFADEKTAADEADSKPPMTVEEAAEAYEKMKDARRAYEKVAAKNLLTEHDELIVGDLLRGKISLENLDPAEDNVKGITAVYEAKLEMEQISKQLADYKRYLRATARKEADGYLETANEWTDKKAGIAYSRETMPRNVRDIVPDRELAAQINRKYFEPVAVAEAASTRFKEQYRQTVRDLGLSRKVEKGNVVSEAHAVQLLGEAMDNVTQIYNARGRLKHRDGKTLSEWQDAIGNLWKENPHLDQNKIKNAVEAFRKIYDDLFQQMNRVRVANGYEPVNYRKGYFPHFQPGDGDGILAHFGRILGIDTSVVALPTTINGLTHTFKPGIQWFGNAQERLGFNTAYDAVEGFDKYIEGVSSVIHQTQNIQNLRALASQIRYRTSDEGIRKQVDAVYENTRLTEEEKQVQIAGIYEHGRYTLSNFVVELDEYTNLLANKKSKLDRTVEALMGRRCYTILKWWEGRVGANMIAGNLSSAITNFIPLTQSAAQIGNRNLFAGMWNTLKAYKNSDGIVELSTFLTNRRGSDPLVKTWAEKASKVAGKPMEWIDTFVSDSIVRGAYYHNLKQGMSEAEALYQADVFAANVMADRSKGAMPTLFSSTNPLFKAFTQFQLEVNNQFSEVFKDLPRGFKEKGLGVLAGVLFKYFLGAWLFNELYEYLFGRRPALDPIGILNETVGDLSGYELPNLLELGVGAVTGDMPSFETEQVGIGEAAKNLSGNLLEELPFSSGLTLLGIETDGGRIPASSAVPDLTALWDAATTEGWSWQKRTKEAWDEISKPLTYIVPPFGGNQLQKIWKGLAAYFRGGSYTVDKDGNDILQYPVYNDAPEDAFWNAVRAAIMGKSSLPEAQEWVDSGFDSLSAKQTAAYQDMQAAGVADRDAYALLMELQNAVKTDAMSKTAVQREILRQSDVSGEGVAIAYYGLVASDADRELMDRLTDLGAEPGETVKLVMDLRETSGLKGLEKKQTQRDLIVAASMTDEEKSAVMESILGSDLLDEKGNPSQYAKFLCTLETGLSVDEYLDLYSNGTDVDKYFEFTDAGVDPQEAKKLVISLEGLEPTAGADEVAAVQKWRATVDGVEDAADQLAALSAVMTDAQHAKAEIAYNFEVMPDVYVSMQELLPKYDADGNGSYKQAEITAAINAMGGSTQQKAVLWQLATGSTSAKNNPYSAAIGNQVIAARQKAKEEAEEDEPRTISEEIMRQLTGGK